MLDWLRGAPAASAGGVVNKENDPPQTQAQQTNTQFATSDYNNDPETPAGTFALKAFRSAVFGTPHPKAVPIVPAHEAQSSTSQLSSRSGTTKTLFGEATTSDLTNAPDIPLPSRQSRDALKERINFSKSKESLKMDLDLNFSDDSESELPEILDFRTPIKRPGPGKPPVGILLTPGITNTNKKKAVSFAASTSDEVKPRPQARIRSNLPNDLPGKFPSPWTPKTVNPKGYDKDATSGLRKSLFDAKEAEDESTQDGRTVGAALKGTKKDLDAILQAKIAAHNEAMKRAEPQESSLKTESNTTSSAQQDDADVTLNLDLPRSTSGKYWKERVEEIEAAYESTLIKAQKWQEVTKVAKGYARKKDAQCAELAEKLREYIRENGRLIEDLKEAREMQAVLINRLGNGGIKAEEGGDKRQSTSTSEATKKDLEDLRATIAAYEKKMEAMTELLEQRDEEVTQLSIYIDESPDIPVDTAVRDLRKQLRKARTDLREMTLVKVDNESKNLRLITLERELSTYKSESARLEAELRDARGGVGETTHIASRNRTLHENRLRLQVERLEQDKINLMTENRDKLSKEAQERREIEKTYKAQIRELDSRLDAAQLVAEKREMEHDDLLRRVGELEKQLSRKNRELDDALRQGEELKKNVAALAPSPGGDGIEGVMWQAKQRGLLSEVRAAKEEAAELKLKLEEKDMECQNMREDVVKLRFKLHDLGRPVSPAKGAERDKDVEMNSPITTPPLRTRLSRTSLGANASPARSSLGANASPARTSLGASPARSTTQFSSPSRQLQLDNAGVTSPNRFVSRRATITSLSTSLRDVTSAVVAATNPNTPAKDQQKTNLFITPLPASTFSNSPTKPKSTTSMDPSQLDPKIDLFGTSVMPSSPPEIPATTNNTESNAYTNWKPKPSPRPHIIPVSFSSSSPSEPPHMKVYHPTRVTKRASTGNEIGMGARKVSASAARRISMPGSRMDAARVEAAKARLLEKKKLKLAGAK